MRRLRSLFSPWGRIGRRRFWFVILLAAVLVALPQIASLWVYFAFADDVLRRSPGSGFSQTVAMAIVGMAVFVASLSCATYLFVVASARRFNDRGKSSWWVLFGFLPVIGPIGALIELGFVPGTTGRNRYGPAPRRDTRELVAIFSEHDMAIAPERGRVSNLFAVLVAWVLLTLVNIAATVLLFQGPQ